MKKALGKKLSVLRNRKRLTQTQVADVLGIRRPRYNAWENGISNPAPDMIAKLADFFDVPTDYLLGQSITALIENRLAELNMSYEDLAKATELPSIFLESLDTFPPQPWDYDKGQMIDKISKALRLDRDKLASAYARQEPPAYDGPRESVEEAFKNEDFGSRSFGHIRESRSHVYEMGKRVSVPIIGTVSAGLNGIAFQEHLGTELVDEADLKSGQYFWLRVRGDSMAPSILENDLALFRVQPEVQSGELAVVVVDGEFGTLKRVMLEGEKIILRAFNPYYPDRVFEGELADEVRIVGRVLEIKRKF